MGIMSPVARLILKEHKRNPLTGDGLLIGRQTVHLTPTEAKELIREEGIELRKVDDLVGLDTSTRAAVSQYYISDSAFFALFSDIQLSCLDVTDYENADIIHDLQTPPPEELRNRFDFIFNGSCLDNIFDAGGSQKNTCQMLKPGGRIITTEMASPDMQAYSMFSQAWFFDYYAVNNFANFESYTCIFREKDILRGPYSVFCPSDYISASQLFPKGYSKSKAVLTIAIAESEIGSDFSRNPIQYQYRPDHELYLKAYSKFTQRENLLKLDPKKKAGASRKSKFFYIGKLKGPQGPEATALKRRRQVMEIRRQVKRMVLAILHPFRTIRRIFLRLGLLSVWSTSDM